MLFGEIILPMLVVAVVFVSGCEKVLKPRVEQREMKVALIQPSIPQSVIWDESESEYRFQQLLKLSRQALTNKPDLLIWPETSYPRDWVEFSPKLPIERDLELTHGRFGKIEIREEICQSKKPRKFGVSLSL